MGIHEFSLKDIAGKERSLGDFQGKALLVVNVASRCGLTPQYTELQALYGELHDRGLEVLGVPCNQFAGQEPGSEAEIQEFCSTRYNVEFPLFSKVDVNGPNRHALYEWLTAQKTAPEGPGDVQWNFAKFVVDRQGNVVGRFSPTTAPSDPELRAALEKALS
ncbi:MAG TPA: glutathione peroxidase [Polyangiaceae bacterium]|nr:glutathione peroxidase [Polyangiaceae bacterium]